MSDHPFCSAADQDIGNAAVAVGAHDDQITILFLGKWADGGFQQVGCIQDFFDLYIGQFNFLTFLNTEKNDQN